VGGKEKGLEHATWILAAWGIFWVGEDVGRIAEPETVSRKKFC